MKKIIVMLMTAALVLPVSCTMDEPAGGQPATSQQGDIEITVADFVDADGAFGDVATRSEIVDKGSGIFGFNWVEDDEIGVFPNFRADKGQSSVQGLQQLMVTVGSDTNGQTIGTTGLSGTSVGWRIETGREYAAYYPMIEQYEQTPDAIHFNYSGQVQNGNNSLAHLGAKDFLVAAPCTATQKSGSEYGQLKFKFSHVGAVVRIRHTITEGEAGGSYSAVNLQVADFKQVIPTQLNVDLFGGSTPAITSVAAAMSDTFTVEIENCPALAAGNNLDVWMMLPPMNLSGKQLIVKLCGNGSTPDVSYIITGRDIAAGKSYAINNGSQMEYVDLGLPTGTLWATMDIGASSETEKGLYYSWGDIRVKTDFSPENCMYYDDNVSNDWSKYNNLIDDLLELEPEDDVATHSWGSSWRLPYSKEWFELKANCTIIDSGTYLTVTGKNSKTLRLHKNAYNNNSTLNGGITGDGYSCYWCKDKPSTTGSAYFFKYITSNTSVTSSCSRNFGISCRAVKTVKGNYAYVDLGLPSGTLWAVVNLDAVLDINELNQQEDLCGDLYPWGCDKRSEKNAWDKYDLVQTTSPLTFKRYNTNDGKLKLDKSDDVANIKLGGDWAIPTKEQWKELIEYCEMSLFNAKNTPGENGIVFKSTKNEKILRLPAKLSARPRTGASTNVGPDSYTSGYWSSTRVGDDETLAYIFALSTKTLLSEPIAKCNRCFNLSIRPVNNKNVDWSKLEKYKN